jgi:tetratricopeptide (TPR) repeat protein
LTIKRKIHQATRIAFFFIKGTQQPSYNKAPSNNVRRLSMGKMNTSSIARGIVGGNGKSCYTGITRSPSKRRHSPDLMSRNKAEYLDYNTDKIMQLNNEAVLLYSTGDYANASNLFQEAASLRQETDSPNGCLVHQHHNASTDSTESTDPPTSSYIYQRLDFDEGMVMYSDIEPLETTDHPLSVQAKLLFNAGQAQRKLQDLVGAQRYYESALQNFLPVPLSVVTSLVVVTVHKIIIPILHNMGQLSYRKGDLCHAVVAYKLALVHCLRLNGERDLSVARTLNCLGVLYYHMSVNKAENPVDCFQQALSIQRQVLGRNSRDEATTLNNLGRVHVQQEEFDKALEYYDLAMTIRKEKLGVDDIDYAATAFNAGQSLHQKGEHDQAIKLYKQFLRVAVIKFSKKHRDVAVVLSGIAQIHQQRKESSKALDLYRKSLQVGREALGENHLDVAMLLNRIGNFYFELENFEEALKAYQEGLCIERNLLDANHPNIIVTLCNIGEVLCQRREFDSAIRLYTEAADLQKQRFGENSAELAGTLNVIGLIYDQNGDTYMATKKLQEALVMRRNVLGDDHLDVANTLTSLGTIFYRRTMIATAIHLFAVSLRIRQAKLFQDHRDVSFTMYNLGLCHHVQGSYREAIKCYNESLRIEKIVLGEDHKDVSMTLYKLGEANRANGDADQALICFEQALSIERITLEKEDPAVVARTLNEIGNIHLAKGNVIPMMKAFVEAARIFRAAGLSLQSVSVDGQLYRFSLSCPTVAPAA